MSIFISLMIFMIVLGCLFPETEEDRIRDNSIIIAKRSPDSKRIAEIESELINLKVKEKQLEGNFWDYGGTWGKWEARGLIADRQHELKYELDNIYGKYRTKATQAVKQWQQDVF